MTSETLALVIWIDRAVRPVRAVIGDEQRGRVGPARATDRGAGIKALTESEVAAIAAALGNPAAPRPPRASVCLHGFSAVAVSGDTAVDRHRHDCCAEDTNHLQ